MPDPEEQRLLRQLAPEVDLARSRHLLRTRRRRQDRTRALAVLAAVAIAAVVTVSLSSAGSGSLRVDVAGPSGSATTADIPRSSVPESDPTTITSDTTATSAPTAAPGTCPLAAEFTAGPPGWNMTVQPGAGDAGDGPSTWWHINGPSEGRFIQILRGSSPFPPASPPPEEERAGKVVSMYEIEDGYGATVRRVDDDPASPCAELHLLGWGIGEADLRSVADGIVLAAAG